MGRDVQRQVGHDHFGNGHGPLARRGLGRPEGEPAAALLAQLPGHAGRPGLRVDVTSPQGRQLTPAQTVEHGEQDQSAIPGTGRVGQGRDLGDRQHPPLIIAFTTGHERRISAAKTAGFIIGLAGTLLIFPPWQSGSQIASAGGLACLGAAASYGISYVYMDRYLARRGIPPLVLSAAQLTAAAVLLAVVLPFAGLQAVHLRWDAIAALAVLGILGTGIAYILNYRLITDDGTTASIVTYLLPTVAVILGAAILSDKITVQIVGGMLIVLIGVAITRRQRPANSPDKD